MSRLPHIYVAVIDDDDSLSRSLSRLLRVTGFQTVTYNSAESFLADGKRPKFDCLVFDIQLGGICGIELNEQLKSSGSTTPVIFNTAHDDPEIREKAIRSGCAAYLRKTESGETVLAAIAQAIQPGPLKEGQ